MRHLQLQIETVTVHLPGGGSYKAEKPMSSSPAKLTKHGHPLIMPDLFLFSDARGRYYHTSIQPIAIAEPIHEAKVYSSEYPAAQSSSYPAPSTGSVNTPSTYNCWCCCDCSSPANGPAYQAMDGGSNGCCPPCFSVDCSCCAEVCRCIGNMDCRFLGECLHLLGGCIGALLNS